MNAGIYNTNNTEFLLSHFIAIIIKTHSSVSVNKKTKDVWRTSVLFTGTVKLPNSAFHISKTTKPISTKFIYVLLYIYHKSGNFHVKIIHALNIHMNLFLWVYDTHKNISTLTYFNMNFYYA